MDDLALEATFGGVMSNNCTFPLGWGQVKIQKYLPKPSRPSNSTDLCLLVSNELIWANNLGFQTISSVQEAFLLCPKPNWSCYRWPLPSKITFQSRVIHQTWRDILYWYQMSYPEPAILILKTIVAFKRRGGVTKRSIWPSTKSEKAA